MTRRTDGRFWLGKQADATGPQRAVVLCRQSITKAESISLEDQELRGRAYAEGRGYHVVSVLRSESVKGWRDDREDHAELRRLAAERAIDVVISYDVTRTARTVLLVEQLAADLERQGVRLEFAAQDSANQPAMRQLLSVFAEMETAHRSVRLTHVWATLRARGRWHGAAPYGYRRENRSLVVDDSEAPGAMEAMRLSLTGMGMVRIAAALTDAGYPTRSAATWDPSTCFRIVTNPVYAGGMRQHGQVVWPAEGETWHPALIDRETWETLQARIARRPHVKIKPVSSWCEGFIYHDCGDGRTGRMYLVTGDFRCRNKRRIPVCVADGTEVRQRRIEYAARECIAVALQDAVPLDLAIAEAERRSKADGTATLRASIVKRRRAVIERRARAETVYLSGRRDLAWWLDQERGADAAFAALDLEESALPAPTDGTALREAAALLSGVGDAVRSADGEVLAELLTAIDGRLILSGGAIRLVLPPPLDLLVPDAPAVRLPPRKAAY